MKSQFKNRKEIQEYIDNHSTPFSEFEKRIDYSLFTKQLEKKRKPKLGLFKKAAIAFTSVVLIIAAIFGIRHLTYVSDNGKCPFELGTYTFSYHEGELGHLDFDRDSYIVLSNQEIEGEGSFVLKGKNDSWTVYGKFNNCEFENERIEDVKLVYKTEFEFNVKEERYIIYDSSIKNEKGHC